MKSRQPMVASFDDLMESRYGKPDERLLRGIETTDELFASYYGKLPARKNGKTKAAITLSIHCDDGKKMLAQRNRFADGFEGYSPSLKAVLPEKPHKRIGPLEVPAEESMPAGPVGAAPATAQTPAPAAAPGGVQTAPLPRAPTAAPAPAGPPPAPDPGAAPATSAPAPVTSVAASRSLSAAERAAVAPTEDDFLADMKSIFTGQSVYDPLTKKTVRKEELKEYKREPDPDDVVSDHPPSVEPSDSQKIFDKIAQSMQYAGAYDLGTVDLENRFADFDRIDEIQKKAVAEKRMRPKPAPKPTAAVVDVKPDSADFLEDLDAIKKQTERIITAVQPEVTREASIASRYSEPLYDTGEHVLAGGDLYRNQLLVGKSPGVAFSYGDIIAMADLFSSVDQMMSEDANILRNLKRLIDQSTAYYKGNKAPSLKDVSNADWDIATGGRYLKLAEDNYDHFAPNFLYKNEAFARNANRYSNHQEAWEQHHERAIKAAQEMALDPANANVSYVPIWPLIINAFGDHFLTDAFAAGHVINKKVVVEYFKSMFYSGKSLKPEGRQFFEKLAAKAWYGDVAAEFKKLETADEYFLWWNPDIKNAERFGDVLKRAAEQEPDKIANIAVKAVHDMLNRDGIDVVNNAGSAPWKLTGDGYLTPTTLAVMKQAVQASAETITDPGILRSNIPLQNYFAKVWAYVPKLTPASETKVKSLISTFVSPTSTQLIDAATKIVHNEVDSMIKVLIEKKALQRI